MKYEDLQKKKVKSGIALLYVFLILPFLSVAGIRSMAGGLYSVWQAGSMYALLIIVFLKAKYARLDSFVIVLAIYEALMIGVSTYQSGFSFGIAVVSMFFILMTISIQFYRDEIIQALTIISIGVILINMISVVGNIAGTTERFFLGGKNFFSIFMIPAAAFIIIRALQKRKAMNFFEIFVLICILVSILVCASGAGIVCALLAIVMFSSNKIVQSKRTLFFVLLLVNVFLLFGFSEIIKTETWLRFTEWLGKEATMTGRTTIWETSIDMIEKKWLLGYGRAEKLLYLSTDEDWVVGYETHNIFLQVLFVTGVAGLSLFLRYLAKALGRLNMNNTVQRILFIAIFICLVNGLVEANNDNAFFRILLALAYYYGSTNAVEKGDEVSVGESEETAT